MGTQALKARLALRWVGSSAHGRQAHHRAHARPGSIKVRSMRARNMAFARIAVACSLTLAGRSINLRVECGPKKYQWVSQ